MGLFVALVLLLIIPIVIIWMKVYKNSEKIDRLKAEVRNLKMQLHSLEDSKTSTKLEIKTKEEKTSIRPQFHTKVEQNKSSLGEQIFSDAPTETMADEIKTEKSPFSNNEWELFIGGKVLNRLGALALVIGFGFFLKYAFDNNLISETIRVLIGGVIGILLLLGGLRFYKKEFQMFSQGLAGAGISILYLSVYASFNYYSLISQSLAFGLMSIVTIVTFAQAFYYDSLTVSILGWAGGFLTPFLLSTGEANEVGLFSYILILDIGLIIVSLRKKAWVILEVLTIIATYIVFYMWFQEFYSEEKLIITTSFLTGFWLTFYFLNLIQIFRSTTAFVELRQIVFSMNIALYFLGLYLIVEPTHHEWMGLITLSISIIYFITFSFIRKREKAFSYQQIFMLLIALILLTLSISIQFEKFIVILLWSLEAGIILWIGLKKDLKFIYSSGLVLITIIVFGLISIPETFTYFTVKSFDPIINLRAVAFLSVAALFGIGSYMLSQSNVKNPRTLRIVFNSVLSSILFLFITVEIFDFFSKLKIESDAFNAEQIQFQKFLVWSVGCSLLSIHLVFLGYLKKLLELVVAGILFLSLSIVLTIIIGISYVPIEEFQLIINFRSIVFVLIFFSLITHLRLVKKNENQFDWLGDIYKTIQVGSIIIFLTLITGEIRDYYEMKTLNMDLDSSAYLSMMNLQQLILSSSWLVFSIALIIVGIWQRSQVIRLTSIIIFGIAILKIFLYDLSYLETLYRIFSFIGLGIILMIVSFLYQKYKHLIFE